MAEVTYFVALPFIAGDDGVAASEATECFNPTAVVRARRGIITQTWTYWRCGIQPNRGSHHRRLR
jgi:hypothetical protein